MDRRKFLSLASFAGVSVASLDAFGRVSRAGSRLGLTPLSETYTGPLFITINASGGWDPTSLCDPKGAASDIDPDAMNWSFRARDIATTASGIRYAPLGTMDRPDYFAKFFEKHARELLVINGVHVGTRGHMDGARNTWSGQLAEGLPSFAALASAVHGREQQARYLSFGGYHETMGEVTRLRGGPTPGLARIADPDHVDDDAALFEPQGGVMFASRAGADELRRLQRYLPELDDGGNPLIRQIQVAIAAYRAGITTAVNLELEGFDTHQDHDAEHIPLLCRLLEAIDFVGHEAARQEVEDNYVVVVGSEFGRSPGYNDSNGKDHWPVTSMLALGKGIAGGRVVGGTTERHEARTVDPRTLAVSDHGVRIEPRHVHHGLRRLAGIDGDVVSQLYPLAIDDGEALDLFGLDAPVNAARA